MAGDAPNNYELMAFSGRGRGRGRGTLAGGERDVLLNMNMDNDWLTPSDEQRERAGRGGRRLRGAGARTFGRGITATPMGIIPPNATRESNDLLNQIAVKGDNRMNYMTLLNILQNQPIGSRTLCDLSGWTIGLLAYMADKNGVNLHGYYLSGNVVLMQNQKIHGQVIEDSGRAPTVVQATVERRQIAEFPLWRVEVPDQASMIDEGEMSNMSLIMYLERVKHAEGGSNIGFYILWENCTIKRRHNFPQYIDKKTHTCLTGGFPQILPEAYCKEFDYLWTKRPFLEQGQVMVASTHSNQIDIRNEHNMRDDNDDAFRSLVNAANQSRRIMVKGKLYIPSGRENCVQDCIKHCYMQRGYIRNHNSSTADVLTNDDVQRDCAYIDSILLTFKNNWVTSQIKLKEYNTGKMANSTMQRKKEKASRRYTKMISAGYNNRFLRYLVEHFWGYGIWLHMYYLYFEKGRRTRVNGSGYRLRDRGEDIAARLLRSSGYAPDALNPMIHIYLFQMRIGGTIYSNDEAVHVIDPRVAADTPFTEKDEDKTLIGYMHMIGIYPDNNPASFNDNGDEIDGLLAFNDNVATLNHLLVPKTSGGAVSRLSIPAAINYNFTWGHNVDFIRHISETMLQPYMSNVLARNRYDDKIDVDKINFLVEYQNSRQATAKIPTLIFSDPNRMRDFANDPRLSNALKLKQHNAMVKSGRCGVAAYDLETVTLTKDVLPRVNPTYLHNCAPVEELTDGLYGPVETEIPFSAQWAPVNCSMEGRMFERAQEARCRVERYEAEESLRSTPIDPTQPIHSTTNPVVGDVILQEVETLYGNDQLGDCITEMLNSMANWAYKNDIKFLYAYAHNGSGFDAYIVLRYCRFEIVNLLKTARGIIILDYKVPVPNIPQAVRAKDRPYVTIRLRDTRLWMSGSLHRIASALKCPKVWQKLDFPITMLTADNCYHPTIKELSKDYGENDVRALAWVVKRLNWVIGESTWDPASPYSVKPAIGQFVTVMAMVKAGMLNHFNKTLGQKTLPVAVDIPSLRNWLKKATIGGRVEAYARSYFSPATCDIITAWKKGDVETLKLIHQRMKEAKAYDIVLDVTSLYPTAQALCPMPTGKLYSIATISQCNDIINAIRCDDCEAQKKLCLRHRNDGGGCLNIVEARPFAIILVKNVTYDASRQPLRHQLFPFCARKLEKDRGLVYTFESTEEIRSRLDPKGEKNFIRDIQSYTNVDLYWMRRLGFSFEIVGGFGWETSDVFRPFLLEAFECRKKAKQEGNSVMSELWKLKINGSYGVTAQSDIEETSILITLPEELRKLNPIDGRVTTWVKSNRDSIGHSEYIKDGQLLPSGMTMFTKCKAPGVAEYFMALSPMHIGAAVLAWARHIVNLIMFSDDVVFPVKYTDTDSIDIPGRCVEILKEHYPGVIDDRASADLGTLKNDHLESCGNDAIVFASVLMTKKVKGHFVLNSEGKVSICTTFKGLNPKMLDDEGRRYHTDRYEHYISRALLDIHFTGVPRDVPVTTWKRSLERGIEITDHPQSGYGATYLDRSIGVAFIPCVKYHPSEKPDLIYDVNTLQGNGLTEMFIPYGSNYPVDHYFVNISANPAQKDMRIAHNKERLQYIATTTGLKEEDWYEFIDMYYARRDEYQLVDNVEYQQICQAIEGVNEQIYYGGNDEELQQSPSE